MQKEIIQNDSELKIVGLSVRTNNREAFNPELNKIFPLITRYFQENIAEDIPNRKNPGTTFAVYTAYESDEHGDYTYFFGEEVVSFEGVDSPLSQCTIPAGRFAKFTTPQGPISHVVIDAWTRIWKMTAPDLGGKRQYLADFEVYDGRASDPSSSIVDIYVGVEG